LVEPKPRHEAFYLDMERKRISGRKFYFHHTREKKPLTARSQILSNRAVKPLASDMGIEGAFLLWGLYTLVLAS
jgi:hypothetical protein